MTSTPALYTVCGQILQILVSEILWVEEVNLLAVRKRWVPDYVEVDRRDDITTADLVGL